MTFEENTKWTLSRLLRLYPTRAVLGERAETAS